MPQGTPHLGIQRPLPVKPPEHSKSPKARFAERLKKDRIRAEAQIQGINQTLNEKRLLALAMNPDGVLILPAEEQRKIRKNAEVISKENRGLLVRRAALNVAKAHTPHVPVPSIFLAATTDHRLSATTRIDLVRTDFLAAATTDHRSSATTRKDLVRIVFLAAATTDHRSSATT